MPRRSKPHDDLELLRQSLVELLVNFAAELKRSELRAKVCALVPAFHKLRDLGSSLVSLDSTVGARDRIIFYLQKYPRQLIAGDELMVVSGIGEWARRVRELRVEHGWWIYSGVTFRQIAENAESPAEVKGIATDLGFDPLAIGPDQYVLVRDDQDRDAAYRWNTLNDLRKADLSVKDKILGFLRKNVGKEISGEELRYLANDKSEWPRRIRELRTEDGWPVKTKSSGRPDLPVGVYVLEEDHQSPPHDRKIPDDVRVEVLTRDKFSCANPSCRWNRQQLNPDDPRTFLELHHVHEHGKGGKNIASNLVTMCNVCHDKVHRKDLKVLDAWYLK